jgi:steroid delta-isomerase-like uncharacterized protein
VSAEEHKALIRRFVEEAFNAVNLAVVDQPYAARHVSHSPGMPAGPRCPEEVRQFVTLYRSAFPDLRTSIEDMIAEGDNVAYRWTAHGTHHGDLMSISPTRKQVTSTGITLERRADGKIVDEWNIWDQRGLLQQFGAMPTLGKAAT